MIRFKLKTEIIMANEEMSKDTWKKIITFVIEILKLIVAGFLGANGANMLN